VKRVTIRLWNLHLFSILWHWLEYVPIHHILELLEWILLLDTREHQVTAILVTNVSQGRAHKFLLHWLILLSEEVILSSDHSNGYHRDVQLLLLTLRCNTLPVHTHSFLHFSKPLNVGILKFFQSVVGIGTNSLEPKD